MQANEFASASDNVAAAKVAAASTAFGVTSLINVSFVKSSIVHVGDTYVSHFNTYYNSVGGLGGYLYIIIGSDRKIRYK